MSLGGLGLMSGPASVLRFTQTRGRLQGSPVQGVNYPSPFFDIAHTYLPVTVKQLFRWCRYYFLTNPLINATCFKLSEYPITDIIIDHEDRGVVEQWTKIIQDDLRYRAFQVEVGLDFHCYGNAFIGIGFPFNKYLKCQDCGWTEMAKRCRNQWVFTNYAFRLACPKCGMTGDAIVKDQYLKNASGIKLIRWNPEDIEIIYNEFTGEYTYFYTIPAVMRNDIIIGRKEIVEGVPQIFVQALKEQKGVVFSPDSIFHLKRPSLATQDRGWGMPLILPVLKDTYYLQLMKKAQEAILVEHIVPLRVVFPQPASGTADPFCVSPETLVEVPEGVRPASEIQRGDYLRSHTGAWRRVLGKIERGLPEDEKAYKLEVSSLTAFPFSVSEEHPILAVPKTNPQRRGYDRQVWTDPEFIEAEKLRKGDFVAYPIKRTTSSLSQVDLAEYVDRACTEKYVYRRLSQTAAEIYEYLESSGDPQFNWGECAALREERGWTEDDFATARSMRREGSIDRMPRYLPIDARLAVLIGYYLAEGSGKGGLPNFSLHLEETRFADEIEQAATRLGFRETTWAPRPDQNGLDVTVQDIILGEFLEKACGRFSCNKKIPQFMSEVRNENVLKEMLRCIFNGDGCDFRTETNCVALKSVSPHLALEVRRLLLSFGLIGSLGREVMTEKSLAVQDAFHLNYNGPQAEALRLILMGGIVVTPPHSNCGIIRGDYVLLRLSEKTEDAAVKTVIGFEMAEDKSFCVAGVATHNTSINLQDWRDHVSMEFARWRYDNNYIPILPLPIGNQTIGGDGKSLMLTGEIREWSEQLCAGMGVPREFIFGGLSYAGSNVSMRMMENSFIGYVVRHKQLLRFIMREIANFMDWPLADARHKPFKMADDIQRKAFRLQLNMANKISDKTLLSDDDLDSYDEDEIMKEETKSRMEATKTQQLAMANIQGEAQVVMMKYQAKAQKAMTEEMTVGQAAGEPGGPDAALTNGGGVPGGQSATAPGGDAAQLQTDGQPQVDPSVDPSVDPTAGQVDPNQQFTATISSSLGLGQKMDGSTNHIDLQGLAMMEARQLSVMDPANQQLALRNIRLQSAEMADLVIQLLHQLEQEKGMAAAQQQATAKGPGKAPAVDMRPMPEKLPQRRSMPTV